MRGSVRTWAWAAAIGLGLSASPVLADGGFWLGLSTPDPGATHTGPTALTFVRGRAGLGVGGRHDVVLVLDLSGSTLLASGADVDGDGEVGHASRRVLRGLRGHPAGWPRIHSPSQLSSDPDDTIRAAELVAARRLINLLDLGPTRVGLVAFHEHVLLEVPVGADREALTAALDHLSRDRMGAGATNFETAIDAALGLLADGGEASAGQQAILFLSDGQPTAPIGGDRPVEKALEASARAAAAGVRLDTFALGPEAIEHHGVFAEMAEATGGVLTRVDAPADIVDQLPRVALSNVAGVDLVNETLGAEGRAVRILPDGSFDGFVRLAPGDNRLRITARTRQGAEASVTRRVRYELREPRTPEELARHRVELERFQAELRRRTLLAEEHAEIEQARARRERQDKDLTLEVEAAGAVSAAPPAP